MVTLTAQEKKELCIKLATYLPKIREILHISQKDFAELAGISKDRISRIENGHFVMTWSQLTSILFVCMTNLEAKEYLLADNIMPQKFYQYMQRKVSSVPPALNIVVRESLIYDFLNGSKCEEDRKNRPV